MRGGALIAGASLVLVGCAAAPVAAWEPPAWAATGVSLATGAAEAEEPVAQDLGFVENRIRNDAAAAQLRYVEIPGSHPFNDRVREIVAAALSGAAIVPEVFPVEAGLADRGCVEGSLDWPAERVLSDPLTGPAAGAGVALTCDVVGAFGGVVAVGFRTVTGGDQVNSDTHAVLHADLVNGTLYDGSDRWRPEAAAELWRGAVEQLRRQAGGLSAAPIVDPGEDQLALATAALETMRSQSGGGAVFTLPAGIASPELAGLGIEATSEELHLSVEGERLDAWESEQAAALRAQAGEPFVGLPAWNAGHSVDCTLQACVAITYDDGPSQFTAELLDTLHAKHAPATFYMLGNYASGNPDLVRMVADAGHELGSHTMSHPDLARIPVAEAKKQVLDAANLLESISGKSAPTFRPPYGEITDAVISAVGKPSIHWSIDTNDWQGPGVDELVARAVGPAEPGDIILFHDTHADSVNAAAPVIDGLRNRGLTPVTVTQLFGGSVPAGKVRHA